MNVGIQDAANLGWKLAAVRSGADPALLESYNAERGRVGDLVVRRTSRALSAALSENPLVDALRDGMLAFATSVPKLRENAQTFISEIGIDYRQSFAVEDCIDEGGLQAGDRMPDLDLGLADGRRTAVSTLLLDPRPLVLVSDHNGIDHLGDLAEHAHVERTSQPAEDGSTLIVIRPDGYIGFRGTTHDRTPFADYRRFIGM